MDQTFIKKRQQMERFLIWIYSQLHIKLYNYRHSLESQILKIIGSGGTKGVPEIYRQSILHNLKTCTERLFIGSAGIETIMLAKNEIQFIFHGRVTPWDHSPMDLITKEAGGCVYMTIKKREFNIKSKGSILAASNDQIWNNIRNLIIPYDNPYRKYKN